MVLLDFIKLLSNSSDKFGIASSYG